MGGGVVMAEETDGRLTRFLSALAGPFKRRTTPQPQMPLWTSGIQEPVLVQGITIPALYAVSSENLILRTVLSTMNQEIFRRGYHFETKFTMKCEQCDEEYQHKVETCDKCGGDVREPDNDQTIYAKWLFQQENSMEQSFMGILSEIEYDLDIVDDAFLILIKEYFVDPDTKQPVFYRVKELVRGDPIFMRIISDKRGTRGGRYKVCLLHRDQVSYPGQEEECEVCGGELYDAHYINMAGSGKTQYFVEGEVIHISKYNPSKLYGKSPVSTLWRQAMSLTAMDNYIYTAYSRKRIPKGIVSITTDNLESMKAFWKAVDEKMERDPHYVPKIGIESQTGKGGVNWTKFMDTLEEMQYMSVRDEIRQRIAGFYGVSNIFMMDAGKSGGLGNEGLQMVVTNRAVEFGQKIFSNSLFPKLFAQMQITDWKLLLYPSEEEDEVTRLRRDEMEVNIAQRMTMLGFQPELKGEADRDIRFTYKQPEPGAAPGGAPGGAPGAAPGMPPGGGMMPPGGGMMPPGGGMMPPMPPGGAHGVMPPNMMHNLPGQLPTAHGAGMPMPPSQPGGAGVGVRNTGPAAPQRTTMMAGAPTQSVQQRGMQPPIAEQNVNALLNARRPRGV